MKDAVKAVEEFAATLQKVVDEAFLGLVPEGRRVIDLERHTPRLGDPWFHMELDDGTKIFGQGPGWLEAIDSARVVDKWPSPA